MIDYKLKSEVLKTDYCYIQKKISKSIYLGELALKTHCNFSNPIQLERGFELLDAYELRNQYAENNPVYWNEACKINHANYQRSCRLKKRITTLVKKPCVFLTLTFNDKYLNDTTAGQRRNKVIRFLKSFNVPYVANIDFGSKNGREHYHAIIQLEQMDCSTWIKSIGGVKTKKVIDNSEVALSKYIAKLTNHAIKETTRRTAIIYSR